MIHGNVRFGPHRRLELRLGHTEIKNDPPGINHLGERGTKLKKKLQKIF